MPFVRTDFRQCPLFKLENFGLLKSFCARKSFEGHSTLPRVFSFPNRIYVYKLVYEPHPQPSLRCLPSGVLPLPQQPQEAELSLFVSDIAG